MQKTLVLAAIALATVFIAGCAGPEKKFGRGLTNIVEPVRLGEMTRSVEQNAVFYPNTGYATGFVKGLNKTLARTGLGAFEIITFPIPAPGGYDPIWTNYLSATPAHPDSYKRGLIASPTFDQDIYLGATGGEIAPFVPGSRFNLHTP
jgi:putative exosortase-associated protein (TIGR04073 family)